MKQKSLIQKLNKTEIKNIRKLRQQGETFDYIA